MGALHEGHAALIRRARKLAGRTGTVVVSIFVNPAQFGPNEDFSKYPRPIADDTRLCRSLGVNLLFAPGAAQMYSETRSTWVDETDLSQSLCGISRPGHFRGVCTVVTKLFHLIAPDMAVFGKKDFQQLAIIRKMTRDLNFPVRIVPVETVREPDGLAFSSRNRRLTTEERAQAPVIRRALAQAGREAQEGKTGAIPLTNTIKRILADAPLAKVDYVEIVDAETLRPVEKIQGAALAAAAVFFGDTRLIDNIILR